jgi:type IV pilus assembly protein PilY1
MTTWRPSPPGSGGRSAYYWAGAAYWANTQPIREDVKDSLSMKHVRVKTFTIDVDEAGNGDIEDTNPRGIKPRQSSFYLAGKYGWFNDANLDGNPFRDLGRRQRQHRMAKPERHQYAGRLCAGQPGATVDQRHSQVLWRSFQQAGVCHRVGRQHVALHGQRPNGDFFAPLFNAGDWSGTVQRTRLVLNTSTQQIESTPGAVWDAGVILTMASSTTTSPLSDPYVKPVDRKIFTMSRDGSATGRPRPSRWPTRAISTPRCARR